MSEAGKGEEHWRYGGRRPRAMELYLQQHDDVFMINAKSKGRSDRSLQAVVAASATPCMFTTT